MTPVDGGRVSAAVLAGGESRRMGRDKAWLDLGDGVPLIQRALAAARAVTDDVFVVDRDTATARLGERTVPDRYGRSGALGALATALAAAARPLVCVIACDLPFASPALLRLLVDRAANADGAVPWISRRYEPLCAVYARSCLAAFEDAIRRGELAIHSALAGLNVRPVGEAELRTVDPALASFTNLNTPGDLARARRAIALDQARYRRPRRSPTPA